MVWMLLALLAAVSFGTRGILYQWASRRPLNANVLVLGVYVSGTVLTLSWNMANHVAWVPTAAIGCLMGLFSFVGNVAMLRGFAVGKASLVALLTGLPSLVVACGAFVLWDERLRPMQVAAFALIVSGIVTIRYTRDLTAAGGMRGFGWGLLALVVFGFHDLSGKWAMRVDAPQPWSLFMLFATASVLVASLELVTRLRAGRGAPPVVAAAVATVSASPTRWSFPRTLGMGLFIGLFNLSGTFFLMRAFDLGITGLVSATASMNVVLIIAYAGVFLGERFALKEWIGMCAALVGVVLLSVFQ